MLSHMLLIILINLGLEFNPDYHVVRVRTDDVVKVKTAGYDSIRARVKTDPLQNIDAAFRLFESQNIWNFLLLDTRDGRVWQFQYGAHDREFKLPMNSVSLIASDVESRVGRFTLYPTFKMWNFLLLDQDTGTVWRCQLTQN